MIKTNNVEVKNNLYGYIINLILEKHSNFEGWSCVPVGKNYNSTFEMNGFSNTMFLRLLLKKIVFIQTSYKKQIPFQQEMKGSAEIITEDLRLLERILYQFRDIFTF